MISRSYIPPRDPADEAERLRALEQLKILDTGPEREFDTIVALAADRFDVPTALVSLVAADRQWFKARVGLEACETSRDISFCGHAILGDQTLVVLDALSDHRFAENPLVVGELGIRFYAGAPLTSHSGHKLGTLCLIDNRPRESFSERDVRVLELMASQVVSLIELRRRRIHGRVSTLIGDTSSDAIICANTDNRIVFWNRAAEAMFGWSAAEAMGQSLSTIMPERHRAGHAAEVERIRTGRAPKLQGQTVELVALRRNGEEFPVELSLSVWTDPATGKPAGFASIVRDVSTRKALEAERARTQALLDTVIESMPAAVFVKEAGSRRFALVNRSFEELTQQSRDDLLGRADADFFPAAEAAWFEARDSEVLLSGEMSVVEEPLTRPDGTTRMLRTKKLAIDHDAEGTAQYLLGFADDITSTREAQARLRHLAAHDELTGLANRVTFSERLAEVAASAAGGAVFCIDLDRFKAVNDLYGHHAGDALLVEVAERLQGLAMPGMLVARLGGDELALVAPDLSGEAAGALAHRIVTELAAPYDIRGNVAHVGASVGIALAPIDGADEEELLRNADLALYRAKNDGRGRYRFFELGMDRAARERRELEADLRAGLARGEVVLVYQPLASLESGQIDGFEALARWQHPTRGVIGPEIFIPIAEESGLIVELGRQVLAAALNEAATWAPPLQGRRQSFAASISPQRVRHGCRSCAES